MGGERLENKLGFTFINNSLYVFICTQTYEYMCVCLFIHTSQPLQNVAAAEREVMSIFGGV